MNPEHSMIWKESGETAKKYLSASLRQKNRIQTQDFYFGACMFSFFKHNSDTTPSIIESTDEIQVIKMTTNTSEDFYIIMKYTKNCQNRKTIYKSWTFPITDKDREMIKKYHDICENIYFFLFGTQ